MARVAGPFNLSINEECGLLIEGFETRPAFGLGHHVWENFVEARVYDGDLTLDPALVTQILSESPCEPWHVCSDGPMEGRFDVEKFVYELSVKTVNRLKSTAAMSWKQFWQAGADFWREYMTDSSMKEDGHYLTIWP